MVGLCFCEVRPGAQKHHLAKLGTWSAGTRIDVRPEGERKMQKLYLAKLGTGVVGTRTDVRPFQDPGPPFSSLNYFFSSLKDKDGTPSFSSTRNKWKGIEKE